MRLGELGELLFDGGSWHIYRNGVGSKGKTILWQNIETVYLGGSTSSVNFVPSGEKQFIKIVNDSGTKLTVKMSGLFRMSGTRREEFSAVYTFILQNVFEHQWAKFIQRLSAGENITFGQLDVSSGGIYCTRQYRYGRDKIEENAYFGANRPPSRSKSATLSEQTGHPIGANRPPRFKG